ncbi:hypothetical protein [Lacticaseibacillus zeae]|uniref:Prepilin type IV endopeptidase peptidase domain-containing protein n=1 Tax=Lacticaseibacillus zeae subsp. silagei TaxID=3068307 RepID=A0ABD7ZBK0_LACZE|nr:MULTISPECIES: hypothetical protein [Lacticaseibacillus]MDE3314742.1 hypothetical protein [Lacticaseibacillus zeae]OFR91239.1 hypothetical protein HMPREF2861_01725 [Lactobacillus sp. HMSC068F07]WLV84353.1 hypothetical protein LACZS2_000814 [Lacticaseibacillus sp. NCIMB 15475]WLV87109.1 hypothetical protein LACZS1_000814 [Lacticaseibacillus sp. NCIMB 15474]
MKKFNQNAYAAAFIGQVLAYPFLIATGLQISWNFQLIALLLMTLCLAGTGFVKRYDLMLLLAAIMGLLGAINQWLLLPLIAVQLVITLLLRTQKMPSQWMNTVIFGQALLAQVIIIYACLHFFNRTMLLDLALLYLPALIGLWANHLPKWADLILLLVVGAIGYFQQRMNLIAIAGMLVVALAISSRRSFKLPAYSYQFSPLIMALLLYLTRLHG